MAILYSLLKKNPHFGKEKAEGRFYAVAQHNGVVKEMEFAKDDGLRRMGLDPNDGHIVKERIFIIKTGGSKMGHLFFLLPATIRVPL